jgi:septum site-determining protein MinC
MTPHDRIARLEEGSEPRPPALAAPEQCDGQGRADGSAAPERSGGEWKSPTASGDAPFQLRGHSFPMTLLKVLDPLHPQFFPMLAEKVGQAPNFFRNTPVVLDLESLPQDAPFDFREFSGVLRSHGLVAVTLLGGNPRRQEDAMAAGLALLPARQRRGESEARASADRAELPYQRTTQMVTEPVRSGRQIYAQNGDLIVCASVSPGAELLADGNIHVYGALRGRALAGASGDSTARIFCQSLEAELVSIAGLYLVSEDMGSDVHRRQVQVHVRDGCLHIDPMNP